MTQDSKVDLVGVGLNATDTLIHLAKIPLRGAKVEFDSEKVMPGGQVASTVVACQGWGLSTRYVGKLGNDDAARLHEGEFARLGVDAKLVYAADAPSPKSIIMVDYSGERTVLCKRDERLMLHPDEMKREWIVNARMLHLDGHDTAAAIQAAKWAREAGIPVVADLDELYPRIEELVALIDYLIVNSDFPSRLMGESDLRSALRKMHSKYGCRLAASTLGPDGVVAFDGKEFLHRAAFKVQVADTTGAGDIFRAGFIYGLMNGWPLERQLDFACAAGGMNCTGNGARCIGTVESIEEMIHSGERYAISEDVLVVG
jgi:sulfofructose kinase